MRRVRSQRRGAGSTAEGLAVTRDGRAEIKDAMSPFIMLHTAGLPLWDGGAE